MIISSKISVEQIKSITALTDKTPLQIYKAIEQQLPCTGKVSFRNMIKIGSFLFEHGISFQVLPELPVLTKFDECYPDLAEDYKWVLEKEK